MELGELTRKELISLCEDKGIKITGQPKKDELVAMLNEDSEVVVETAEVQTDDTETADTKEEKVKSHKVIAKYIGKAGRIYFAGEFDDEVSARKHLIKLGAKGERAIIEKQD